LFGAVIAYLALAGEPRHGILRYRWLPYLGWGVITVSILIFILASGYGYFEVRVREEALNRFGPWTLSPSQRHDLGNALDETTNHVPILFHCLIGSSQSQSLTQDLITTFKIHGWINTTATCFNNLRPDIYGVGIALPTSAFENFGDVPPSAEAVSRILAVGGLRPRIGADSDLNSGFYVWIGNRLIG
jgi:hypothetical protein